MALRFRQGSSQSWQFLEPTIDNVATTDLPLVYNYDPQTVLLTDESWLFELNEISLNFTTNMVQAAVNPKETFDNPIVMENGNFRFELYWMLAF